MRVDKSNALASAPGVSRRDRHDHGGCGLGIANSVRTDITFMPRVATRAADERLQNWSLIIGTQTLTSSY